ncbi:MAG: SDR family NAD(P)-dependent oxidoreductase, partial [Bacillus sp. (in: firmicutes)]
MNYTITGATGHLGAKITEEALKIIDAKNMTLSVRSPQKADKYAAAGVTVKKANYYSEEEL